MFTGWLTMLGCVILATHNSPNLSWPTLILKVVDSNMQADPYFETDKSTRYADYRTQSTCWFTDMERDFLMKIAERLDLVTGLNVAKKDPASILRPYDTFESEMFQASCLDTG